MPSPHVSDKCSSRRRRQQQTAAAAAERSSTVLQFYSSRQQRTAGSGSSSRSSRGVPVSGSRRQQIQVPAAAEEFQFQAAAPPMSTG